MAFIDFLNNSFGAPRDNLSKAFDIVVDQPRPEVDQVSAIPVAPDIPVESPSSGLEVASDFAYSNENNAEYQKYNYYDEYLDMIQKGADIGLFSTAQNAVDEAQKDRAFQALEAEKTRDWYEKMSDTSYQRQVKDLEAAGLNPILGWAHSGVGAPTAMSSTPQGRSTNIQSQAPSLSDYVNAGANVINSAGKLLTSVSKLMIPL